MDVLLKLIIGIVLLLASSMQAQSLEDEDLRRVREAVVVVCGEFAQGGSSSEINASGAAGVELKNLARILADLGLEGDGDFSAEEYVGVLREELGEEILNNRACRLKIWSDIVSGVNSSDQTDVAEKAQLTSDYGNSSGLFDCKSTQNFEVCVDSSRIRGAFADLSLTLRNRTDKTLDVCQSTPHAYAISEEGKKTEVGIGPDCRRVVGGGLESFSFLFEFESNVGGSYDATVVFSRPSTQITYRNLR